MGETPTRSRNVRKLLSRLNPKAQGFHGGCGGIPVETAIDIAGAVGMAAGGYDPQRLAVLVLCLRWWPGMFEGPRVAIGHRIVHHDPKLHDHDAFKDKKRKLFLTGCCERIPIEGPSETAAFRRLADLVAACLRRRILLDFHAQDEAVIAEIRARLHGEPIPRRRRPYGRPLPDTLMGRVCTTAFLQDWSRVVIAEFRKPNPCPTCQPYGRIGEVARAKYEDGILVKFEWTQCEACWGSGVTAWSSHRRAAALHIGNHPFRDFLKVHHDGALALLRTLEDRGARALLKRLSDER